MSNCQQFVSCPDALLAPRAVLDNLGGMDDLRSEVGLGPAIAVTADLARMPISRDPTDVIADLRGRVGESDSWVDQCVVSTADLVGTFDLEISWRRLSSDGCRSGHGFVAWMPVPVALSPAPWRPRDEIPGGRPVVALLDTAVEHHPWLTTPDPDDPFWVRAGRSGWTAPTFWPTDDVGIYGTHRGHGTFSAGVIRQHAPDVQVLSVPVMGDRGRVWAETSVAALEWLAAQKSAGRQIDVVCIPYGRERRDGEGETIVSQAYRKALVELGQLGVKIVASAGNCGCDCPTYPAAYAAEPDMPVISVGSGAPGDPDDFSNRGEWVEVWGDGKDVVSTMPISPDGNCVPDAYARWSGTSFAAAKHAGQLAQALVGDATPGASAAARS